MRDEMVKIHAHLAMIYGVNLTSAHIHISRARHTSSNGTTR